MTVEIFPAPKATWYRIYNAGAKVGASKSNKVNHDWYNMGQYSYENCGLACATMALKRVCPEFYLHNGECRKYVFSWRQLVVY
ncbi:MAG: hypothetical protein LBH34_05025 [Prevotellaceae bacterium]|nr:hypothetical protein [Prevotellaceae bacterium]